MFKLNAKFDADLLLHSLSHFECNSHRVHMFTQCCLPPPMTSIVKLSLFTHVHSSSLSLSARLHRCCSDCSHYVNNVWTFPGQVSCVCVCVCVCMYTHFIWYMVYIYLAYIWYIYMVYIWYVYVYICTHHIYVSFPFDI